MYEKKTLNDYLWKENEELLFKKVFIENKYKSPMAYVLIPLISLLIFTIGSIIFGIIVDEAPVRRLS